ncbi:hypothetical protein [Candidatus Similichlamydia epinepheli]|uniref:hypothetical protein n=1 Tax=Candidatus Similichlamydia epinepheli TaxID=1903953 RepID=UPI0013005837|nr:hypothetical protein [Candidatus Similichlamydia epinepheli]
MPSGLFSLVLEKRRLMSGSCSTKRVYHLVFRSEQPICYRPGDHFIIRPPNPNFLVKKHLEYADKMVSHDFESIKWGQFDLSQPSPKGGFKRMKKRYYSIASTPRKDPSILELIVRHLGALPDEQFGTASYYLCEEMQLGETVSVEIQNSVFHDLHAYDNSVIFFTAGVGIASFIGWIFERSMDERASWLFFGDRDEREDFLHREILCQLSQRSCFQFSTAFSRYSCDNAIRRLGNLITEHGDSIWDWINKGALVLMAGSIPMGKSIISSLQILSEKQGNPSWMSEATDSGQFRHELY